MANKGEWAEHYAFFKVLSDRKLIALDKDKNLINSLYYNVLEIVRDYKKGTERRFQVNNSSIINIVDDSGKLIASEQISNFTQKADEIKSEILSKITNSKILDDVLKYERKIGIEQMKAPAGSKADIIIKVHDFNTNLDRELAFSIKSQWGAAATLVNASKATNFVYELTGNLSEKDVNKFNLLKSFDEKSKFFSQNNYLIDFKRCNNNIFEENLIMIDSLMPQIISDILKAYYFESFESTGKRVSKLSELVDIVASNSSNFNNKKHLEYKVKQYLFAVALGMNPAKEWSGRYEANGGYLIVKATGEIGIYHLINLNEFQDYLYNNTKLETASTGRHEFGKIYLENGIEKINLNLQIRFTD